MTISSHEKTAVARKAFVMGAASPFIFAFYALAMNWPLMLALGVAHHDIDSHIPALGFWPTYAVSVGLNLIIQKFKIDKVKIV